MMRFYSQQHPYYCGIDLHTTMMFCCIVDSQGQIVEDANLPTREARFTCSQRLASQPFRLDTPAGTVY